VRGGSVSGRVLGPSVSLSAVSMLAPHGQAGHSSRDTGSPEMKKNAAYRGDLLLLASRHAVVCAAPVLCTGL